ncbi:hydrogenase maturation factor HoxV/HupK [Ramlibacter sp. AN1133]|uniref:hydrogenase maturation factor HoxV/HupK n=1 Tax=Ramlibacter sp. AN1133 TaxID=3133429 RepID=UPI0030C5A8B8
MNPSPAPADLAGAYRLRPGRQPAIVGERPVLEGRRLAALMQGLPAARAPQACAAVFTLCAHAQRRTSEAAVRAAGGAAPEIDPAGLQFETARDHLRSIALDWPARAGTAPQLAWLRESPLRIAGAAPPDAAAAQAALRAFGAWLADTVLHRSPAEWLARCAAPPALKAWCDEQAEAFPPARTLRDWHALASRIEIACTPLRILMAEPGACEANLRTLAGALATETDFAQLPRWRGQARENGPWTRQRDDAHATPPATAWDRLAARWIELVALAAADAPPMLQQGALQLAPGEAIAWCEMARGLLFHWVRLDANGCVQDYRVLAPTEWNFHPQGSLARALERLAPSDTEAAALLGTAFDACVPCTVAPAP